METGGVNATVKPWLWILMILIGPLLKSIFEHWNLYIETVILVRIQAVLTQLVFEHSLRIRLKAEAPEATSAVPAVDSAGENEDADVDSDDNSTESSTIQVSSRTASRDGTSTPGSVKGKSKTTAEEQAKPSVSKKHSGNAENLLGRINNLITSDLDSIVDGAEFPNFRECYLLYLYHPR